MKINKIKTYIFALYLFILSILYAFFSIIKGILGAYFIRHVFICPIQNPQDFDCAWYYIEWWFYWWLISLILTLIIWYIIFKKSKPYVTKLLSK